MAYTAYESPGMEASLVIQNLDTDFKYDDSIVKSSIDRIAMILFEPSYPSFQPGLQIGAFEINQDNNPVTNGINLAGNYLGVIFRSSLLRTEHSVIQVEGSYAYYSADKIFRDQEINLRWHEVQLQAYLLLEYGSLNFSLGGYTHSINGDEAAHGLITQTRNFEERENNGIHAGLDFWVDATGKVGVHANSGGGKEISLIFTRVF